MAASEAIRKRIDALLSKTKENGATEEEEMAAMAKAMELIAKYQVDMTKESAKKEGIIIDKIVFSTSLAQYAAFELSSCIQVAADVTCFRKGDEAFYFIGLLDDVRLAKWLLLNLTSFALRSVEEWWHHPGNYIPSSNITGGERMKLKQSFIKGIGERCERRAWQEKTKIVSSGTSLVVVKEELIKVFMENNEITTKKVEDKKRYDAYAKASGYMKGVEAQLHKIEEIANE